MSETTKKVAHVKRAGDFYFVTDRPFRYGESWNYLHRNGNWLPHSCSGDAVLTDRRFEQGHYRSKADATRTAEQFGCTTTVNPSELANAMSSEAVVSREGDTDVFENGKLVARFVGKNHHSDALRFVAGEKAIEACKQIAAMWTPKMDEAIKRHEKSGTEAFDDQEWMEAISISPACAIALSALPAEETKAGQP